jgi:hypothetical protein
MTDDDRRAELAFAALRDEPDPALPSDVLARLQQRLDESVARLPSAGESELSPGEGLLAKGGRVAYDAPLAHASSLALALTLGAAVGAGAMFVLRGPEERIVYVTLPAVSARAEPVPPTRPSAPEISPLPVLPKEKAPRPAAAPGSAGQRAKASNGDEQVLLDRARSELFAGDGAAALGSLALHQRTFPSTWLEEERQALRIRALSSVGRAAEARVAFRAFRQRFASSPLIASLATLVREEP